MTEFTLVDNDIRLAVIGWETDGEYWKTPEDRERAEGEVGNAFDRWLNRVRADAWDEGARHVYIDGGKCSFARDGDPCPYNPYANRMEDE